MGFDTSQQFANNLYWEAIRFYKIPEVDWVVPIMVVGDELLIGGIDIPGRFPSILEAGLDGDGIDLPDFPALIDLLRREGMLDTRYPNRRIALQNPQPGAAEAPPPSDSAPQGTPPLQETRVGADSAVEETVEGGIPIGGADTLGGGSRSFRRTVPPDRHPAEKPNSLRPPGSAEPGTPADRPAAEGTPVSPQGTPAGPPGAREREAGTQGPLGMEEAVQDLESGP